MIIPYTILEKVVNERGFCEFSIALLDGLVVEFTPCSLALRAPTKIARDTRIRIH